MIVDPDEVSCRGRFPGREEPVLQRRKAIASLAALAAAPGFHFARLNLAVLCDLYLKDTACALDNYVAYQQAMPDDKQVAGWVASARARAGKGAK